MSTQIRPTAYLCLLLSAPGFVGCRTSPEKNEANFLKRGKALLAQKDYPRALLEFRNAAIATPEDAEPHYQMGLAYLESADGVSAVQAFRKATTLNPKHSAAQLKLAEFMTASRDDSIVQQAVTRLQGAFGDSPNNPEAINTLAIAEWRLGKPEDAAERLEAALKKFPKHLQSSVTLARMKVGARDWGGAEAVLKKAVADAPQSSTAALALGELYISMRLPARAEAELKRAVQLDPRNGAALQDLGALQVADKRIDQAELTFKQLSTLPDKALKPVHALFLYHFGKREAALPEFESLAKSDPADRDARSRLVAAYASLNRFAEAENILAAALKRNPKDADALLQRAELRLRSGKPDDAEKDLKMVIHFSPDSSLAHIALARAYEAKGLASNQQQELQEALRLNPASLPARLALGYSFIASKQGRAALEVIAAAPDEQKGQWLWMVGHNWALITLGNLQEARAGIERALGQDRPPEAVYQSAVVRLLQKDYAGAHTQVEELLKRDGADMRAAQLLMEIYASQRELAKGLDRLKEVASARPSSAPLQNLLGRWYLRSGNLAAARQACEAAKAADPQFLPADLSLGEIDIREGRNVAARQRLDAIVSANPTNITALLLSAQADDQAGDTAAAIARFRTINSLDSSNPTALNNLAYMLAPNAPDEALTYAQKAAEMVPDSPDVQDTLGWIYYRKGLFTMAVRYLQTAVDKESTPQRQFHLGMCYLKVGDQLRGQKTVREALAKDPNLAKTEQGW